MEETKRTIHQSMLQCNNFFGGQSKSWENAKAMRLTKPGENSGRKRMTAQDPVSRSANAGLD
jgi:hypothetical protein